MQEELCYIGSGHRRSDGLDVKTGESFVPTADELAAFGNCFATIDEAKRRGLYVGRATTFSQLESVDAARERVAAEEREIAARRGRGPVIEPEPEPGPEPEPEASNLTAADATIEQLEVMTVAELKTFADDNQIAVSGLRTKADLIEAILSNP